MARARPEGAALQEPNNACPSEASREGGGTSRPCNQNLRGNSGITVTSSPQAIDNLTYTYVSNLNKLTKVEDAATVSAGFLNGVNTTTEYVYNTDGSLTRDDNKAISSITYNMLGKPQVVNFTGGKKIEYIYDAAGIKLTVKTWQGATLLTCTNYVPAIALAQAGGGSFVYEGATPVLSFFGSPEGRVIKNGSNFEYQYAIADHQGNTRVVFTSATPAAAEFLATFEAPVTYGFSMDTTKRVIFVAANHTPGGKRVFRMNQSNPVGPAKSLKVYPGDKVDAEVWTYYENNGGFGTGAPTVAAMVTTIASAFGGVSGGGGESGNIFNGVNSVLGAFGLGGNAGDEAPAAYLNYILYDRNYKMLTMGWQRVTTASYFSKQKINLAQLNITEEGYVFVYLSYEDLSNNFVQFDDFKVTHTKGNVVQYNEYYPFGLQTQNSWTRENTTGNQYLYNGASELNATTGVYDLAFRGYDPVLGRMMQVDPKADQLLSVSPYHYSFNNPIVFNDPMGDFPYTFYVRSFAPFETFGYGFMGDNRGFSTEIGASSRVSQWFTYDTDLGRITDQGFDRSLSMHASFGYLSQYGLSELAMGSDNPTGRAYGRSLGDNQHGIVGYYSGGNPVTERIFGSSQPTIDVNYYFGLTFNASGNLVINSTIYGDEFPAFEAFVSDGRNQIFLGGSFAVGGRQNGPFTGLDGAGTTQLVNNSFEITVGSDGFFTGVMFGGDWYSIGDWQGGSDFNLSVQEFGNKYPDLYKQLFGEAPKK